MKKLSFTMPYNTTAESPEIAEDATAVTTIKLNSVDTRMLNPRKVLVRADISTMIDCYIEGEMAMFSGVESEMQDDIKVKTDSCSFSPITAVREKTFVVSDEYQIPFIQTSGRRNFKETDQSDH